jgi:mercuric ion binding protein
MRFHILVLSAFLFVDQAFPAERRATFVVPDMTCSLCPVTVEIAMGQVAGVKSVTTELSTKLAIVVFDDARASAEQLSLASANAGYPARLVSLQ